MYLMYLFVKEELTSFMWLQIGMCRWNARVKTITSFDIWTSSFQDESYTIVNNFDVWIDGIFDLN